MTEFVNQLCFRKEKKKVIHEKHVCVLHTVQYYFFIHRKRRTKYLSFTMSCKLKRIIYTNEFKLKVISKAEDVGNREAGRLFNIDESNIRLWRRNKSTIKVSD